MNTVNHDLTPFAKGVQFAREGLDRGACFYGSERSTREFQAGWDTFKNRDDRYQPYKRNLK